MSKIIYDTQWFIEKARKVHKNKYDYSKVVYKNNCTRVTIICPKHGEFKQTPAHHLDASGCRRCNIENQTLTTEKFIQKARKVHGNRYDYSKVDYKNAYTKVIIICQEHGEFKQRPASHTNGGKGCPICSNNVTSTTEKFIQKARKVHGNRYDYSKVKYTGAHNKVIIICPVHGEFKQTPTHHRRNQGCPKCNKGYGHGTNRYNDKTPGILYCIKCKWKDNSGYFTKIGITDRDLFKRFPKHPTKKYQFQIVESFVVYGEIGDMQRLEDKVKDEFVEFKYVPKVKFSGYTECFEVTEHDKIVRFIKNVRQ